MTDRELLELAAKAAGLSTKHKWNAERLLLDPPVISLVVFSDGVLSHTAWNPLTKDGDALRLAVKLEMLIHVVSCHYVSVCKNNVSITEHIGNEGKGCLHAATRRAIVRAAAEVGKEMK